MVGVPVGDQDGVGNCYAFSLSRLLMANYRNHPGSGTPPTRHIPSPWEINFALLSRDRTHLRGAGGILCDAFNYIKPRGTCDTEHYLPTLLTPNSYRQIMIEFWNYWQNRARQSQSLSCTDHVRNIQNILSETVQVPRNLLPSTEVIAQSLDDFFQATRTLPPELTPSDPSGPISIPVNYSSAARPFYEMMFSDACRDRQPVPRSLECELTTMSSDSHALEELNRRLTPTGLPLSIGYCSRFLHAGNPSDARSFLGLTNRGSAWYPRRLDELLDTPSWRFDRVRREPDAENCGGHESLVIGRRLVQGRCQYLIQNSWGTSCAPYASAGWDCERDEHGMETGKVWVDAMTLSRNLMTISTIRPSR